MSFEESARIPGKEYIFVQGKAKWASLNKVNKYGDWSIDLYPNPSSLEILRELQSEGMRNVIRKDEDGYNIRLKRTPSKPGKMGKMLTFPPPEVFKEDGVTPLTETNVGNGSDVTVKLEVYSHATPGGKRAKAARLMSVRVDNLVPFEAKRDFKDGSFGERAMRGLAEQPPQEF